MQIDFDQFLNDYCFEGFMLVESEDGTKCHLAFGDFSIGINKNALFHFTKKIGGNEYYVLTEISAIKQILNGENQFNLKEDYDLSDLTKQERDYYIFDDPSCCIYKDLIYSIHPDVEPNAKFELI